MIGAMGSGRDPAHDQLLGELQRIVSYIEAVYRAVLNRPPDLKEAETHANAIYQGLSPMDFFDAINASDERRSHAKLFAVPGSYQSPVANPAELQHYVDGVTAAGPEITGISVDRAAMIATWQALRPFLTTCPFPHTQTPGYRYFFANSFYGFGDGLMLHAMLRRYAPKRFIEIGSGFSSACAVDTIDGFLNGACELTFVEPHPERLFGLLGGRAQGTRILNMPVQSVPLGIFEELEPGDILFIDSSHVLRTGSDVCFELFEILPRLASGVIVHVHDVLWPFDYPKEWILQQNRSYNEAYALRAFLIGNPHWRILFFNDYFAKFEAPLMKESLPQWTGDFGGSFWFQRC